MGVNTMMSITNLASSVRRILVEKKQGFDLEAKHLKSDLEESLNIDTIENLRILNSNKHCIFRA